MHKLFFAHNTTTRWSFRAGDYLLWVAHKGFAALRSRNIEDQFDIADLWEMKNGDFVTITNRHEDLPSWFTLHPLETAGAAAYWMQKKLNAGYKPSEPIDGPNIWRIMSGARLVWVGVSRPDIDAEDGILGLMSFHTNALVIGEPFDLSSDLPMFGGFTGEQSPEAVELCKKGFRAACRLGLPRSISADGKWRFGS